MKIKLLFLYLLMLLPLAIKAQDLDFDDPNYNEEIQEEMKFRKHLKFMGTPICGTPENFCAEMEKKGFVRMPKSDRQYAKCFKKNNWGGQKLVYAYVSYSPNNNVDMVLIMIPCEDQYDLSKKKSDYILRFKRRYDGPYTWQDRTDVKEFSVKDEDGMDIGSILLSDENNYLRIMYMDQWGSEVAIPVEDDVDKDIY